MELRHTRRRPALACHQPAQVPLQHQGSLGLGLATLLRPWLAVLLLLARLQAWAMHLQPAWAWLRLQLWVVLPPAWVAHLPPWVAPQLPWVVHLPPWVAPQLPWVAPQLPWAALPPAWAARLPLWALHPLPWALLVAGLQHTPQACARRPQHTPWVRLPLRPPQPLRRKAWALRS